MFLLSLAWRSLGNRRLISTLTAASIALSVALLVGIEHVRLGVRESFAGTIRGTDLIVGARGGTTQVLLSTVFGMSVPNGSVSWATYERWAAHPAVKWTIPYALGDAHRGHRVIGTTAAFFAHYRFRDQGVTFARGNAPTGDREIAVGSEVAERLGYSVGSRVTLAHGLAAVSFAQHEAHPFTVSGVIARTFTPIDRALYTTLEGLTAMHEAEEQTGGLMMGPPAPALAPEPVAESPAVESPSAPKPAPGPMAGSPSFDELAFLNSVVGRASTPMRAEPPSPRQSRPMNEVRDSAKTPMAPPTVQVPRATTAKVTEPIEEEAGPLGRPTPRTSQAIKTLKCQECGTLNYPTEWYCERCGGELAAL